MGWRHNGTRLIWGIWLSAFLNSAVAADSELSRKRAEELLTGVERTFEERDFARIRSDLDEALRIGRELKDARIEAKCLLFDGILSNDRGDLAMGAAQHRRALELAREAGDAALEATILTGIGHCYWGRADYGEALRYHLQALALETESGDLRGEAVTRRRIGQVYFKQGLYDQALDYYERSLQVAEAAGDLILQSRSLESLGSLYRDKFHYTKAIDYYLRALRNYEALSDLRGQGVSCIHIGLSYCFQGAYQEALAHFRQALQLAELGKDLSGRARALRHLGLVYGEQGLPGKAVECYQQYLLSRQQAGDRREEAWALAGIGLVHRRNGENTQALPYHKRAEAIWEEIGDRRALADDIRITGDIYLDLGDYESALRCYIRARDMGEEIHLPYLSLTLGNLGRVYALLGGAKKALSCGQQAIEDSMRTGNEGMRWVAAYRMAVIQRQLGMREQALLSLRESLTVIEELRTGVSPDDEAKAGFLEDKQIVFAETIDLLIELGRAQEALDLAERARARAFLDLLRAKELHVSPREAMAAVASRRPSAQTQVAASTAAEEGEIAMRGHEIVKAEIGKLRTQGVELASLVEAQPQPITQLLDDARHRETTVIEYFVTEHRLFIWVFGPGGDLHVADSPMTPHELDDLVRELRGAMQADVGAWEMTEALTGGDRAGAPSRGAGPGQDPRAVLRRLHQLLIQPIEPFLPNNPHALVTVIPHGPLFLVSFAALLDKNGRYFIEQHTIHYSPAMSVLRYTAAGKARVVHREDPHLFVVGNPAMPRLPWADEPFPSLPGAEAEARAIGRLFPSTNVIELTGTKAGEQKVRELAGQQTMIHLATHCVIRDDLPLESFLALAPAPPEDGRLTAREVFDLDLHADLVVLSACNTGLGKVNGDGVIGLSRAFLYAGTPSVIVSLWRVADLVATTEMEKFYAVLKTPGGSKAAALRTAQLDMISQLRGKKLRTPSGKVIAEHPIYWAPFVLIGEAL